ncbi:MAG: acyl-CoA dehydrogenase [Burkholderiaceae bacterium]|nr:MAG: acyl-CoA dehydrogenase [Burkholderiaceae bacterium]TAM07693.1 MAG: acyl-CoA dehydrogenase [Pusillimonas sp.]
MLRPQTPEELAFRAEVAEWMRVNIPEKLRYATFRPSPHEAMSWYKMLAARGWVAPHWPVASGGMGATPTQQVILMEEMARAGAPDFPTQGLNHIGPILIKCGTPLQQKRFLSKILSGDEIWCQGYSEPGAGSDLASLCTRATVDGDSLVISGHKIWTTWGHHADWMFALVRTSDGTRKQQGITFVLIDLKTAGISRRPIRTIAGDDEFCEVFLDSVRVPMENIVGEIDQGWKVATALLSEERLRIGAPALALKALERLRHFAAALPRSSRIEHLLAEAEIETETLIASFLNVAEREAAGNRPESSYLKVLATETVQKILDSLQEVAGESAPIRDAVLTSCGYLDYSEMFLQSRRLTIYGGTNEIQRTIIATKVLGLPRGRRSA